MRSDRRGWRLARVLTIAYICLWVGALVEAGQLVVLEAWTFTTADRAEQLEFYGYSAGYLQGTPDGIRGVLMVGCPWVQGLGIPPYCGTGHYYPIVYEGQDFLCADTNFAGFGIVPKPPCSSGEFGIYSGQGEIRNCSSIWNCASGPTKWGPNESAGCYDDDPGGGQPGDPEQPDSGDECVDCEGSPIVLDFDENGFRFSGVEDAIQFDIDADGELEQLTWTTRSSGDAFLALDRNLNEVIDSGSELFGNNTPLSNGALAAHGYIALAELDSPALGGDSDGWITAADGAFSNLLLWTDSNHNGHSEANELVSLSEAGVTRVDLDYHESRRTDAHGNHLRFNSRAFVAKEHGNGVRRIRTTDVFFVLLP